MPSTSFDFVVAGGGIVGLTLAHQLRQKFPTASILVAEKETTLGKHASGRNSGVVHAGIYYPADTLKAKLCVEGAATMRDYCARNGLPIARFGKVILPTSAEGDAQLEKLFQYAKANGVETEAIGAAKLKDLEPAAAMPQGGRALYSPNTASVDPKAVLQHLAESLVRQNVAVRLGAEVTGVEASPLEVVINGERTAAGFFINAAGAYADRFARPFGIAPQLAVMPFRGSYYELDPSAAIDIKGNIYPVPDPRVPFLGVHFSRNVHGKVFIGPTAFPVLGREHYGALEGVEIRETPRIMARLLRQYLGNKQGLRDLMHQEIARLSKRGFLKAARRLVPSLELHHLKRTTKCGIRPQLFDKAKGVLVMDFMVENTPNSLHVLNAISPAFTCSFAFARHLVAGL